jgi:hypothetical protein
MPHLLVHFIFNLERRPRRYACLKSQLQIPLFVFVIFAKQREGKKSEKREFLKLSLEAYREALSDLLLVDFWHLHYTCTICLIKARNFLLIDLYIWVFKSCSFLDRFFSFLLSRPCDVSTESTDGGMNGITFSIIIIYTLPKK